MYQADVYLMGHGVVQAFGAAAMLEDKTYDRADLYLVGLAEISFLRFPHYLVRHPLEGSACLPPARDHRAPGPRT